MLTLFTPDEIKKQIREHEGVTCDFPVADHVFFNRRYKDMFPKPLESRDDVGALTLRISIFLNNAGCRFLKIDDTFQANHFLHLGFTIDDFATRLAVENTQLIKSEIVIALRICADRLISARSPNETYFDPERVERSLRRVCEVLSNKVDFIGLMEICGKTADPGLRVRAICHRHRLTHVEASTVAVLVADVLKGAGCESI